MTYVFPGAQIVNNLIGLRDTVTAATTANLTSWVYSGAAQTLTAPAVGVQTIDGYTWAVDDRILVKDQTTTLQNGVYKVTTAGAVAVIAVLTRDDDMQTGSSANNRLYWIQNGTLQKITAYVCTSPPGTDIVNTDNILFSRYDCVGTLAINRGGTNATTFTTNKLVYYDGTSLVSTTFDFGDVITSAAKGTLNHVVRWGPTGTPVIKDSTNATIDDSDNMTGMGNIGLSGNILDPNGLNLIDFQNTASAVNWVTIANSATGVDAVLGVGGEVNRGLRINDGTGARMLQLNDVASSVNYMQFSNAATAGLPVIEATGSDTNVNMSLSAKGTGYFNFSNTSASASAVLRITDNDNAEYVAWTVPASVTASYTLTLPPAVGTTGQVLSCANGTGTLQWSSVSSNTKEYELLTIQAIANSTSYTVVSYFAYKNTLYTGFTTRTVYLWAVTSNRALDVEIFDGTTQLGTVNVPTSTTGAIFSFTFTDPAADKLLQLRIKRTSAGGSNPSIYAASLEIS